MYLWIFLPKNKKICKEIAKSKRLRQINDNYEKIVLTMDKLYNNTSEDGIKIKYLIDWLLGENI